MKEPQVTIVGTFKDERQGDGDNLEPFFKALVKTFADGRESTALAHANGIAHFASTGLSLGEGIEMRCEGCVLTAEWRLKNDTERQMVVGDTLVEPGVSMVEPFTLRHGDSLKFALR